MGCGNLGFFWVFVWFCGVWVTSGVLFVWLGAVGGGWSVMSWFGVLLGFLLLGLS